MIKCRECEYCHKYKKTGNTRYEFSCDHPDKKYINNYFFEHRMLKTPGFLGFDKLSIAPIKTSPAWCPLKKENKDE